MHVARYLEEHHFWPDNVPLYDWDGEFTRMVPSDDELEHHSYHHDYDHYHDHYSANEIEETAEDETTDDVTINIKGPIIMTKQENVRSLLRQAMEDPLISLQSYGSPQTLFKPLS